MEKEAYYKELLKQRLKQDDYSETSSNYSEFILLFKNSAKF